MLFRRVATAALLVLAVGYGSTCMAVTARDTVLQNAKGYWQLGTGGAGSTFPLTQVGAVSFGAPVGIGANPPATVAQMTNAYFDAGSSVNLSGTSLTVYLRARDPLGTWSYGLLAKRGGPATVNYNLFSVDLAGTTGPDIGFEILTDQGFFQVSFPVSQIGADAWHDFVGRYDGSSLELFCDGRLMAQTTAGGALNINTEPMLIGAETDAGSVVRRFTGQMEEAAVYDRALDDAEIGQLCRKPLAIRWPNEMVHYKPFDYPLGDVRPEFVDGVYYLSYLYNPPSYDSAIIQSTDLINWQRVQPTHTPPTGIQLLPPYYILSVIRDPFKDKWRTYYGYSGMRSSVSDDLINWDFAVPQTVLGMHPALYSRESDPTVFWNPDTSNYWMVMTLKKLGLPGNQAGAVGYATSNDLSAFTWQGELYYPGNVGDPECPSMFKMGSKWYLLASYYNAAVGKPSYRMSSSPFGPWSSATPDSLDGKDLCAAMSCDTGSKRVLFGWIPLLASQPGSQYWGGHMGLPREVYQAADTTLRTKLDSQVGIAVRGEQQFPFEPVAPYARSGSWSFGANYALFNTASGTGRAILNGVYDRIDMETTLSLAAGTLRAGFALDWSESSSGFEAMLDKANQRLYIATVGGTVHAEIAIPTPANTGNYLRLVVEEDIVELFYNNQFTLAARIPKKLLTTSVGFVATNGPVNFSAPMVNRLKTPAELRTQSGFLVR